MTARHVVAILIAVVGTGAAGVVITSAVRRLLDWQDRRAYVPPATAYTEVRPAPLVGDVIWGGRTWATRNDSPHATVPASTTTAVAETFEPNGATLAILVALIAQAAEHEARVQRAINREPAAIWCQVTAEFDLVRA